MLIKVKHTHTHNTNHKKQEQPGILRDTLQGWRTVPNPDTLKFQSIKCQYQKDWAGKTWEQMSPEK